MTLKKPSQLIQIDNNLSLLDKKIFNFLLTLKKFDNFYITSIQDIKRFLQRNDNTYNNDIKKSMLKLSTTKITPNLLNKDKKRTFNEIDIIKILNYSNGVYEFIFHDTIEEVKTNLTLFSKLDINILNQFSSKYSYTLYELINDYKRVSFPTISIDTFQKIIGSHYDITNLKNKVIKKSIKEIEEKTFFEVDYNLTKIGNKYRAIQFSFINYENNKEFHNFVDFLLTQKYNKVIPNKDGELVINENLSLKQKKILFKHRSILRFKSKE